MIGAGGVLAPAPTLPPGMLFWVTCLERGAPDLEGSGRADLGTHCPESSSQGWLVPLCHLPPSPDTDGARCSPTVLGSSCPQTQELRLFQLIFTSHNTNFCSFPPLKFWKDYFVSFPAL